MMNKIKYIVMLFSLLLAFGSCSDDDKLTFYPENVTKAVMSEVEEYYLLEQVNADSVAESFKWIRADYGYPAAIQYTLQIALAGDNFSILDTIASSYDNTLTVTVKQVNEAMLSLLKSHKIIEKGDIEQDHAVEFRIATSISAAVDPAYSNMVKSVIQPYAPPYPAEMYMIGADFGNWEWGSEGIVSMIPVNTGDDGKAEGAFWCINYFKANRGFKWSPETGWDPSFTEVGEKIGYTIVDGNAIVAEDGLYMVYIDLKEQKIAIEKPQVFGIGDPFGSWDEGKSPFTIDGKKMSAKTTAAGELRMYAKSSISTSSWWTREFVILDGKIAYRGKGGDQDRVNVSAGSTVTLDFSTGTGEIK